MSAILIKPDSKHKIRNYFQLTARRGLFSFQCITLSTSHNPNNKDNNPSPTYPDEHIPQRNHCFLPLGEAVHFDCPDLCSYLGFGFCPSFLLDCCLDWWDRIGLVGDGESEAVGFEPGFRPGKIGLRPGSIFRNSTVFRCRILDRYRNERIAINDRLPDNDRILTINKVQNSIATVPAGGAG